MLEIIFEDEFIIVCKKMSGIPTQTPKSGVTDMVSLLKNYRVSKGEPPYIGLVHRLDQPVEGVMVFAKDKKSAAALSAQMKAHTFIMPWWWVLFLLPAAHWKIICFGMEKAMCPA